MAKEVGLTGPTTQIKALERRALARNRSTLNEATHNWKRTQRAFDEPWFGDCHHQAQIWPLEGEHLR